MSSSFALPPLPSLPIATPATCVLDAFKLRTAEQIAKSLDIPLLQAFEGIESGRVGKTVKGDFTIAVPRFKLKGDAKAFAAKVAAEVSTPDLPSGGARSAGS